MKPRQIWKLTKKEWSSRKERGNSRAMARSLMVELRLHKRYVRRRIVISTSTGVGRWAGADIKVMSVAQHWGGQIDNQ